MAQDSDVIWSGRPWIAPKAVGRTVAAVILEGILAFVLISYRPSLALLSVPLVVWAILLIALAWAVSLAGLLTMRASFRYTLRRTSMEVNQGLARRRSLIVSPSGFSELEVDQGIMGRALNYGSLEVRSQGGQQLNLKMIKDPAGVATLIREVMTTPTVRIAKDELSPSGSTTPPANR